MSCSFRRTPVTPSPMRSTRCRSCMLTTARPLSYLVVAGLEDAADREALHAAAPRPSAWTAHRRAITSTLSPTPTPSHIASSRPSTMLKLPGRKLVEPALHHLLGRAPRPWLPRRAATPRTIAGCLRAPCEQRLGFDVRRRARRRAGPPSPPSPRAASPASARRRALTVACAAICSMRSRISRWKPLITASVVISAVTPMRDAEDRGQRDEGDEAIAAFGAQVAQADGDRDGFEHGGRYG